MLFNKITNVPNDAYLRKQREDTDFLSLLFPCLTFHWKEQHCRATGSNWSGLQQGPAEGHQVTTLWLTNYELFYQIIS